MSAWHFCVNLLRSAFPSPAGNRYFSSSRSCLTLLEVSVNLASDRYGRMAASQQYLFGMMNCSLTAAIWRHLIKH